MKKGIYLILLVFLISCNSNTDISIVEEELILTDNEFSELSVREGFATAFESYCATDGVILRPELMPVIGKTAVMATMSKSDDSQIKLSWEPQFARAASSGELGYTYGLYTIRDLSDSILQRGTYVTIWEKKEDGWKFLLDSGNEGLGE